MILLVRLYNELQSKQHIFPNHANEKKINQCNLNYIPFDIFLLLPVDDFEWSENFTVKTNRLTV